MTAKREMAYSNLIPIFQQQRKCPHIISTGKSLWKGSCTFNPCRRRCSHRLWRRIYWLCNTSARVAGWRRMLLSFNHFHGGEHYLRFDPAAWEPFVRLFDTEVCWHRAVVRLWVASVLPGFFLQPSDSVAHDVFALHGGVEAFVCVALLFQRQVLLGFNLFTPLLKIELALFLVRFWWFRFSFHS